MADTFRDGKIHVTAEQCGQCLFSPDRIVPGSRAAQIVRDTKDEPGAHFICHKTTIAGDGDAICRGWYYRFSEGDYILQIAKGMNLIEEVPT